MGRIDPSDAAYYAIIAICLVLVGGTLTAGTLSIEQRGTALGAVVAALTFVAWHAHKRHHKGGGDDDGI